MKDNFSTFATDEPTALAYTDFSMPSPVLNGEAAEEFIKNMEEIEKIAEENAKKPKTKEDLRRELEFKKVLYDYEERELANLRKEINKLEKELNAKTEE